MKKEKAFETSLPEVTIHLLDEDDSPAIQEVFDKSLDFMLLVDGHPASPDAGREEFNDLPPGKSPADLFIFGIVRREGGLAGLLEVLRGYPEENTWWIGLLLLTPEGRSRGLGAGVLQGFVNHVRSTGAASIMLGVVEENTSAHRFWSRMGFEQVRRTEPRSFGNKMQAVDYMRLRLDDTRAGHPSAPE